MAKNTLSFTRIDALIKKTFERLGSEKNVRVYPIWKKWPHIVGPEIASKTHPDCLHGNTLTVSVANSVWMNELTFQKKALLGKISKLNLEFPVNDIRFRLMTHS
jgi:predicted nucleic acid-binding Zn ribbon protein